MWRYLDFTKFVALLSTRSLWFSKSCLLADPWEGTYTRANLERRLTEVTEVGRDPSFIPHMIAVERSIYVNCWHMNGGESAAMWRLYAAADVGIVVISSWERLVGSLGKAEHPATHIVGGRVRYLDPDSAPVDPDDIALNGFSAHGIKRPSFAHEREVRLMFWALDESRPGPQITEITLPGIRVPVDLDVLVAGIRLAPGSPLSLKDLIEDVSDRYGFKASIMPSKLDRDPTEYRLRPPDFS